VKGGEKEGQRPNQKKGKGLESKKEESVAVADNEESFAFTCTSDYAGVTESIYMPNTQLGACINSGVSHHFCPDKAKF
jgi:hypothetical protein